MQPRIILLLCFLVSVAFAAVSPPPVTGRFPISFRNPKGTLTSPIPAFSWCNDKRQLDGATSCGDFTSKMRWYFLRTHCRKIYHLIFLVGEMQDLHRQIVIPLLVLLVSISSLSATTVRRFKLFAGSLIRFTADGAAILIVNGSPETIAHFQHIVHDLCFRSSLPHISAEFFDS